MRFDCVPVVPVCVLRVAKQELEIISGKKMIHV